MTNEIKINGTQNFMGYDIPIIEGGFGEGCKVILVKTIAEIHNVKVKELNKLINNNIDEFEFGVDILDLKTGDFKEPVLEFGILTKAEYGNSNNVYLLSEQGYMSLVQLMKTEKAKEIRKKLRREYFAMRAIINSNEQIKRALYHKKFDVKTNAVESLSCKDCIVGGIAQKLVIDDGTLPYYKEVCSLPDETFNAGQYVKWADTKWLIVSCDWDKEVYTYGKMQQCNWLMKWQNADGEIIERWAVVNPASKYSNGEKSAVVITIPFNNYIVYLPNDPETLALPVDKRIFVDFNVTSPKCYKITRIDTVTMSYDGTPVPRHDGKGCVLLVLTECLRNSDTDRIDLMLCDYINSDNLPQPSSPIEITYSGSPEIRIGGRKTFSTDVPVTFSLIVTDMWKNKIKITQMDDHSCKITAVNDSAMVGTNIKIIAKNKTQTSELLVKVIGGV